MELYKKNNISISTIEEKDKEKVLKYFSENSFNCDYETGSLRPTNYQFNKIMDEIILGEDDESNIFVLKKDNEVIGYESMFVEYDRLTIGHIAVDKNERNKGYAELLIKLSILIAENDDRDVITYCNYKNNVFSKLGFEEIDNVHFIYKRKGLKNDLLPKLFVSVEEYTNREKQKLIDNTKQFGQFLERFKKMNL